MHVCCFYCASHFSINFIDLALYKSIRNKYSGPQFDLGCSPATNMIFTPSVTAEATKNQDQDQRGSKLDILLFKKC